MTHPPLLRSTPNSRPYRLYTAEYLSFDAWAEGEDRPAMVVTDGWGKSVSIPSRMFGGVVDDPRVTLEVYRVPFNPTFPRHSLSGQKFDTRHEADRAAYEAGITAFMVYEDQRVRLGLPAVQEA